MRTPEHLNDAQTTGGLPISPSMAPTLEETDVAYQPPLVDGRVVFLCLLSIVIAGIAAGYRVAVMGAAPVFPMPDLSVPTGLAIACYVLIGAIVGVASVIVTKGVYVV